MTDSVISISAECLGGITVCEGRMDKPPPTLGAEHPATNHIGSLHNEKNQTMYSII